MSMTAVLPAVATLTLIGIALGMLLGWAKQRFPRNEGVLIDAIDARLPQTQCGQCGYPGCLPYARAIAAGAAINKCPPGGEHTIRELGALLGREPTKLDPSTAEPGHGARIDDPLARIDDPLARIDDPLARIDDPLARIGDPLARIDDPLARIGDPLARIDDPLARIDDPLARNDDPLARIDDPLAWIGDPLARIGDPLARIDDPLARIGDPLARIDEHRCIGCGLCLPACPVDAIVGAPRYMHTVVGRDCTGCGLCISPCPVDCIALVAAPASERHWAWPEPRA
jgi:Na+-translocating ferredoxin:NAD+ oxidoreductase RNF subunit RnfB